MNKKTALLGILLLLSIVLVSTVYAADEEVLPVGVPAEGSPWYTYVFEPIALIASVVGVILSFRNIKGFGGVLGNSFKFIVAGLAFIAAGFAFRVGEMNAWIPDTPFFPIFVAIGIILILISSYVASKGFK